MNDRDINGGASLIRLYGWLRETGEIDRLVDLVIEKVRDSRQTEKAKDSEPPLRAENERLRKELQGVANHLLSMSGGAHNCAGCGFLHKQIVRALAAPPEEK